MEEKCWWLGGWVGGQAALADLPIALQTGPEGSRILSAAAPPLYSLGEQAGAWLALKRACVSGGPGGKAGLGLLGRFPSPPTLPLTVFHFQQLANTSTSQILSSQVSMS